MKQIAFALTFFISLLSLSCSEESNTSLATPESTEKTYSSLGMVTKVDIPGSKITIDHEEIPNFMKAMEMEFEKDPSVKVGDESIGSLINFELSKTGNGYRVVKASVATGISPKEKYLVNCARCHGEFGEGRLRGIPFTKGHALAHSEEEFIQTVTNGKKKMPSFRTELSDDEIKWVVRYVRKVIQSGIQKSDKHIH
jgi:cytochrome c6